MLSKQVDEMSNIVTIFLLVIIIYTCTVITTSRKNSTNHLLEKPLCERNNETSDIAVMLNDSKYRRKVKKRIKRMINQGAVEEKRTVNIFAAESSETAIFLIQFAVDKINARTDILPNIKLGMIRSYSSVRKTFTSNMNSEKAKFIYNIFLHLE